MNNHKNPWQRKQSIYAPVVQKKEQKSKIKWKPFLILWSAFKKVSMILGGTILVSMFLSSWLLSTIPTEKKAELPDEFVLYIDFDGEMSDVSQDVSFADPFSPSAMTMKDFTDALDAAKDDPRVKGIVANIKAGGYEIANLEEMRASIKHFRDSGKFAYVYSVSYADAGHLGTYYLASAFDEIWMQPMGLVGLMGINVEMPFVRDVLDKIGVQPQFVQRKEYKSAYESFTNSHISEPNREMTEELIGDIAVHLSKEIAKDRGIELSEFKELVSKGLFTSPEAKDAKLVDVLGHGDELMKKISEDVTGDPEDEDLEYVDLVDYGADLKPKEWFGQELIEEIEAEADKDDKKSNDRPAVALVYASGMILSSDEGGQGGIAAADQISQALEDAAKDEDISAIVLRIDSPGGSPVASETILHSVELAQSLGKKVIVSMGGTAASGGYWIAAYADKIYVLPTTITGSIGVLGGKFSTQELWKTIGVNWDRVTWGKNAGMWSMNTPFSESEAERVNAMMDNVYSNFVDRVSKGRKMSKDEVEIIARGRVWSGKRAVDIGIADEFGGLNEALDYAAVSAGVKLRQGVTSRHDVDVVIMPKPKTSIEKFIELLQGQVMAGHAIGAQAKVLEKITPFIHDAAVLSDTPQNQMVYQPLKLQ